jgi:hypothetical protein
MVNRVGELAAALGRDPNNIRLCLTGVSIQVAEHMACVQLRIAWDLRLALLLPASQPASQPVGLMHFIGRYQPIDRNPSPALPPPSPPLPPHPRAGHSLGGALASLAAHGLKTAYPGARMTVYTFGAPRVGNRAFSAEYNTMIPDHFSVATAKVYLREFRHS